MGQWAVSFKSFLGYKVMNDVSKCKYVLVKAAKNAGKDRIVKLCKVSSESHGVRVLNNDFRLPRFSFEFQKVLYDYDSDKKHFARIVYPTIGRIKDFIAASGFQKLEDLITGQRRWGKNEFDIPIQSFVSLFMVGLC